MTLILTLNNADHLSPGGFPSLDRRTRGGLETKYPGDYSNWELGESPTGAMPPGTTTGVKVAYITRQPVIEMVQKRGFFADENLISWSLVQGRRFISRVNFC